MSAKSNRRGRQKRMGKRQSARARSLHFSIIMGCVGKFLHLSIVMGCVGKFLVPLRRLSSQPWLRGEGKKLHKVCVCVFMFLLVCVDSYCVLIRLDFLIWGPKACRLQLRICVDR